MTLSKRNEYAFCHLHAYGALKYLFKGSDTNTPKFVLMDVSKFSNYRCSCNRKAKFYMREISQ